MKMEKYNKISDEELARFLEKMRSDRQGRIAADLLDLETFEVLNVAGKALEKIEKQPDIELPAWDDINLSAPYKERPPLAMAGFLGEENSEEIQPGPTPESDAPKMNNR